RPAAIAATPRITITTTKRARISIHRLSACGSPLLKARTSESRGLRQPQAAALGRNRGADERTLTTRRPTRPKRFDRYVAYHGPCEQTGSETVRRSPGRSRTPMLRWGNLNVRRAERAASEVSVWVTNPASRPPFVAGQR